MTGQLAILCGQEFFDSLDSGAITARSVGQAETPFGLSGEQFVTDGEAGIRYLARHGAGREKCAPHRINDRANIYALKDSGATHVIGFGSCGSVRHSLSVGDLVLLGDVIDQTTARPTTLFPDSPLGYLREFPLFCPSSQQALRDMLGGLDNAHVNVVAAVREGPRMQTPAEIRLLAGLGADVVTHGFVPELFFARELELCYTGIAYIHNYAETGSRHAPFRPGRLFDQSAGDGDSGLLSAAIASLSKLAEQFALALANNEIPSCPCTTIQAEHREMYDLPQDWRQWFSL